MVPASLFLYSTQSTLVDQVIWLLHLGLSLCSPYQLCSHASHLKRGGGFGDTRHLILAMSLQYDSMLLLEFYHILRCE